MSEPAADPFVKRRPDAPPGFFAAEAAGLAWLAEAEPDGGPRVVRVLGHDRTSITLERITPEHTRADLADLGRRLARLHATGAAWFGCPPGDHRGDGFIGPLPMPHVTDPRDEAATSWPVFYARHRIEPFLTRAERTGGIDAAGARAVRAVVARLSAAEESLCGPPEPPARIHGDLWSGNVLPSADGAVLIDPAAHGGHRETDLAMLALFGIGGRSGFDDLVAGYGAVAPLANGWRERIPLHQMHPLLVHAALFGGGYGAEAAAAARALL